MLKCVYVTACLCYSVFMLKRIYVKACLCYSVFMLKCVYVTVCLCYSVFMLQCVYVTACLCTHRNCEAKINVFFQTYQLKHGGNYMYCTTVSNIPKLCIFPTKCVQKRS
jgi:hypothetical protein